MTIPHYIPSDGDIRDARRCASDHWVLEWYNHRIYRVLCFQEATSRRFSLSESFPPPNVMEGCISHVMHSPMSFFETTVRIIGLAEILLPLILVRSLLAVL
jgi:hypothetical protein